MDNITDSDFLTHRDKLFAAIEQAAGYKASTTKGFIRLSFDIKLRTGQNVSASTLKRLYGYVSGQIAPRAHTLDVLSSFAGYSSFDAFIHANSEGDKIESGFVTTNVLYSKDLSPNDIIRLAWHPNRVCVCRHKGDGQFEVIRSEQTRLVTGTTFTCSLFIAGETLFLDQVAFPDSTTTFAYKVGIENGIQLYLLTSD